MPRKTWDTLHHALIHARAGKRVLIICASFADKHWIRQCIEEADPNNDLDIVVAHATDKVRAEDLPIVSIDDCPDIFETRKVFDR